MYIYNDNLQTPPPKKSNKNKDKYIRNLICLYPCCTRSLYPLDHNFQVFSYNNKTYYQWISRPKHQLLQCHRCY